MEWKSIIPIIVQCISEEVVGMYWKMLDDISIRLPLHDEYNFPSGQMDLRYMGDNQERVKYIFIHEDISYMR